jgi:hypothetical protein
LLEQKLSSEFSLMDWKDQILAWLPFVLVSDNLEDLPTLEELDMGGHVEGVMEDLPRYLYCTR